VFHEVVVKNHNYTSKSYMVVKLCWFSDDEVRNRLLSRLLTEVATMWKLIYGVNKAPF